MSISTSTISTLKALILSFVLLVGASTCGVAQTAVTTTAKSRIAVVANEIKTNIWVSDFPKGTTVVLFDEESNILAIQSTNDFGAAYISLPKTISSTIYAKTLNGEVSASNKAVIKGKTTENIVAAKENTAETTKA